MWRIPKTGFTLQEVLIMAAMNFAMGNGAGPRKRAEAAAQ
jgi:hypothetical protein